MAPRTQKPAALKVAPAEVLAAIETLYVDQVRPQGRILLKRLGERAAVAQAVQPALGNVPGLAVGSEIVPRLDTAHIRKVCERCPQIKVVAEAGYEYSALLVGRAQSFVDPCSNDDPYPEMLWSEMGAFFGSYHYRAVRLPGGRYACARALAAANLPFLAGRSLGELCHIVQLAVSQRQVLGYLEGQVVPYFQSEAVVKQHSAVLQQPAWSLKRDTMAVADLTQARECLRAILVSAPETGIVPLPNIKRLFRSRFQLELSETSFGHCRISDLLQDARFHDICRLQLRGNSYVVIQIEGPAAEAGVASASSDKVACKQEVASSSESAEEHEQPSPKSLAARTFIHLPRTPVTPARRSSSVPRSQGSTPSKQQPSDAPSSTQSPSSVGPVSPSDEISTEASDTDTPLIDRLRFCPNEPLWLEDPSTIEVEMPTIGFPLVTPSPQYGAPGCGAHAPQRVKFCQDSPLSLDELPAPLESDAVAFALVTPSPQYEAPHHFPSRIPPAPLHTPKLPGAASAAAAAAASAPPRHTPRLATEPAPGGGGVSLFHTLSFSEMLGIDALAEGPASSEADVEMDAEQQPQPRVPLCSEPLSLEEADQHPEHTDAWTPLPLMTPSPQYHAATYLRHASLRNVQKSPAASPLSRQLRHGLGTQPAYLGRVSSPFPCATPSPQHGSARLGHLPRLNEAAA